MNFQVMTEKEIKVLKELIKNTEECFETNMEDIRIACNLKSKTHIHSVLKLLAFSCVIESSSMGCLGTRVNITNQKKWDEIKEYVNEFC